MELEVYKSIAAITKAIGHDGIAKDRKNQQQGYSFRGIDEVFNALNPLLAAHDLCVLPRIVSHTVTERASKSGGALFSVLVKADFDFVSARDGSKHTVTMYGEGMDSADKATNKAMSAAYKYACFQAFCVPTEGMMEEADATTPDPTPKPWIEQFKGMATTLGKEAYFRILGTNGYENAGQVTDQKTAQKILAEMARTTAKGKM